ncbi:hypothetical protein B0T22DRAFT_435971 [Podospora appendiculata]|uniref:Uncharacterized protein n=1 Tax=Podospora appendiculata TaxID=314037 RepID=A0AAE0XGQ5_9PEZI|nr:hypothetical protein B0T22DRAFT_435971 [Podospora appendiculata]
METKNIMNGKIQAERALRKKGSNKKGMLNLVFVAAAAIFCASVFLDIIQVGSSIGALAANGVTSPDLAIIAGRDASTDGGDSTECTTSLTASFPSPSATVTSATSTALAEGASTCNSSTMTVTVTSAQTATATVSVTGTAAGSGSESWAGTTTVTITPSGAATVTVILNPEDNSTTTLTDNRTSSGSPLSTMASDLPVSGTAAASGIWTTVTSANGTYTYSVPASATATAGQPVPTAGAPPAKKNRGTTAFYCAIMSVMVSAYFMRF